MRRYVIIGAGAIGVSLAAELQRAGKRVALIARGAQLEAARNGGITYVRPHGSEAPAFDVYAGPEEIALDEDDVLILATKTQDAEAALAAWAYVPLTTRGGTTATVGAALPLVTTQNGLEADRAAHRYFATVIGGVLVIPASYTDAGVVVSAAEPVVGSAWVGHHPRGSDPLADAIRVDLSDANFDARAVDDIGAIKNGKLLSSVSFALDALFAPSPLRDRAAELLAAEARAIFAAGDQPVEELFPDGRPSFTVKPTPSHQYGGTSTWQSLRRSGSLETDFINGEVVLQAALLNLTAPVNRALVELIHRAQREGLEPRSLGDAELAELFPQLRTDEILIEPEALATRLRSASPPALLDVRWALGDPDGPAHYEAGHIPGAVYVGLDTELAGAPRDGEGRHPLPPLAELQAHARVWGLRDGQPVVVYDDLGGMSAARAWWLLRWAGVRDVRILNGSFGAWKRAGFPVEEGAHLPELGDVTLSEGHLPTLTADEAERLAGDGVLLDARAAERYRGEAEPIDPRAGHIPGASNWPTAGNLDSDGRFIDAQSVRSQLDRFGVTPGTQVGVYCGSGVTAAHLAAVLALAGVEAALYPGSWSAWSSDPEREAAVGDAVGS